MLKKFAPLAVAIAAMLCGSVSNTAQAIPLSSISAVYFFGDDFTDSGFNDLYPGLPSGKAPTFTTFGGYIWSQYIARDIKGYQLPVYPGPNPADTITNNSIYAVANFVSGTLAGVDYAAAGSTTNSTGLNETWAPSLDQQVSYFLSTKGRLDPNALYFVWSGTNDILALLSGATLPTELQLLIAANTTAANVAYEVGRLSAAGAKRIVVVSMPNLGITPLITGTAVTDGIPTLPATMKTISFTFNSMLNTALGRVAAQYGTKILYEDSYDLLNNIVLATAAGQPYVVAGQSFKFVNATSPACTTVQSAISCPSSAPNNYLFADVLHPTGMTHRIISLQFETDIQNWG